MSAITAEQIFDLFPRKIMRTRALASIRSAMKRHSPQLLLEMTRRFGEAWRGQKDLAKCPPCQNWIRSNGFLADPSMWGPKRGYKQTDGHLFERERKLRNTIQYLRVELKVLRQELAALEAQQLRKI